MKKLFFTSKLTATFAVTGILALMAGLYYIVVAISHIEPYLSSDEKGPVFFYYGGDYGVLFLALGIVLMGVARYRSE